MFNPNGPCKHNSVLRISLQSDEKRNESVLLSGADARTLEYELHAECKPIRDWSFDLKNLLKFYIKIHEFLIYESAHLMPKIMNIPGEIPIGSRIKREFYLTNTITSEDQNPNQTIEFSWSPTSTCSVEPSFGQVEPGQSLPLQLWCSEKKLDNLNLINISHLMAQWVDMEALENKNNASLMFLTLWVRSDKSVISNQTQVWWSRTDMRSVRDFSSMSTH